MSYLEIGRLAVALLLTGALAWAAFTDIRDRKIRNVTVLTVLGLFLPWALMLSSPREALLALEAGGIALLVGVAVYAAGWVGAGDAKLFAAVGLFAGLHHLLELTVMTTLVGGLIAAFSLISRPKRALDIIKTAGKGDFGRGVPYGVAIAVATVVLVWSNLLHLALPLTGAAG